MITSTASQLTSAHTQLRRGARGSSSKCRAPTYQKNSFDAQSQIRTRHVAIVQKAQRVALRARSSDYLGTKLSFKLTHRACRHRSPTAQVTKASIFGVGAPEAFVVGVVALLVFGPKGLAEAARTLGQTLRAFQPTIKELQSVSNEFKSTLENEIGLDEIKKDLSMTPPPSPPPPRAPSGDVTPDMQAASEAAAWGGTPPAAPAAPAAADSAPAAAPAAAPAPPAAPPAASAPPEAAPAPAAAEGAPAAPAPAPAATKEMPEAPAAPAPEPKKVPPTLSSEE